MDSLGRGSYTLIAVLPRDHSEPCSVVVLLPVERPRDLEPTRSERLIGTCGFYARFGAPGRGMSEWLLATRGVHAMTDSARERIGNGVLHRIGPEDAWASPETSACAAGDMQMCTAAFDGSRWMQSLYSRDSALTESTRVTVRMTAFARQWVPGRNFSDLREAMTDERFAKFWQHEGDPIAAYEAVEGRSIGYFVRDRLLLEVEPHRPGPLHADLPTALGVAIGALAAALAIRLTKRQRSGP